MKKKNRIPRKLKKELKKKHLYSLYIKYVKNKRFNDEQFLAIEFIKDLGVKTMQIFELRKSVQQIKEMFAKAI